MPSHLATFLVTGAALAALAAVALPGQRRRLATASAIGLWIAVAWLVVLLLTDDFATRYVWLYSGPGLPWHLKLANLWGGDEGTLLFLAALLAAFGVALRHAPWASAGMLLFAAAFGLGAVAWNPFLPTPAAELAQMPYRGMNAHLMVVWMALHPPALFIAYALIMAPAGAALGALLGRSDEFRAVADRWLRPGWLLLTTGIAVGMWWAFEDFTFGQAWHWDPVQTAVFATWCLATAVLHGLRRCRPGTVFEKLLPIGALLTVACLLASMAVTRTALLQSSHRYIGDTSMPLFVALAVAVLTATMAAAVASKRRTRRRARTSIVDRWVLLAVGIFFAIALVALVHLGHALAAAWLGWSKPDDAKPFFEMLRRFSPAGELDALRRVFARWDVDGFSLNRALAPMAAVMAVVGGHVFATLTHRRFATVATLSAAAVAFGLPWLWQPMDGLFAGTGMTSQKTVAMFYWLDALLLAAAYFLLAAVAWLIARFRRAAGSRRLGFVLPVALVHAGAMTALVAIVFATVLDRYVQAQVDYPAVLSTPQTIAGGFTVAIAMEHVSEGPDGGRRGTGDAGFRAVRTVVLSMDVDGESQVRGETVYRDTRARDTGLGSVRELCRILDYRYARHLDDGSTRLDPFIYRGLWRDVQVWMPPGGLQRGGEPAGSGHADLLVVVRIFPFMSWLWLGLATVVLCAAALTRDAWRAAH